MDINDVGSVDRSFKASIANGGIIYDMNECKSYESCKWGITDCLRTSHESKSNYIVLNAYKIPLLSLCSCVAPRFLSPQVKYQLPNQRIYISARSFRHLYPSNPMHPLTTSSAPNPTCKIHIAK